MPAVQKVLKLVPGLEVELVESSCCGMAGSFGYEAAHYDVSMKMAEASLLPKVRAAAAETLIVADGTSCRHQIHDGAQRDALHVARVLQPRWRETRGKGDWQIGERRRVKKNTPPLACRLVPLP